jgi:hypothetical protein
MALRMNSWLPRTLVGMVAGQLLWGCMAIVASGARSTILSLLAAPLALGGWLYVWGDNGPPYAWIDSWSGVIAVGLGLYGTVGAAIGFIVAAANPTPFRFSFRALLIGVTLYAIVLGLTVWAVR